MKKATETQPIIILLDSVEEIANDPDSSSLSWIPSVLPPNCKVEQIESDKFELGHKSFFYSCCR